MQDQPIPGAGHSKDILTTEEVEKNDSTVVNSIFTGRDTRSRTKPMPGSEIQTYEHLTEKAKHEFCGTFLTID